MSDVSGNEVRYSTKELLDQIRKQTAENASVMAEKIDALGRDVRGDINGLGQRMSRVEDKLADKLPLLDNLAHRLDGGDQAVAALRQRLQLHEATEAPHPALAARLGTVEDTLKRLQANAIGAAAVASFKRQMWVSIGVNGAAFLTAAVALYKVFTGHP